MRLLGWEITRAKALPGFAVPDNPRAWFPVVRESFTGAWQRGVTLNASSILANHAVFACTTLIASDIAKLRVKLMQRDGKGIWTEVDNPAFSPVLRKPNKNQTRVQFWESWVLSKLSRGNTYALKVRDNRNVVVEIYVLDPNLCKPLVADNGDVFYDISADNFSGVTESIKVPATEIIHDRFNCLFHPLVGMSPIWANALAATQGLSIQENSAAFFGNNSQPGGILTAPGNISEPDAVRLKDAWTQNFSGNNVGKVAVLGSGLKYEPMAVKPVDAQLIEQLKWTAEVICSTFHIPPYKIGIGEMPSYNNVQALNTEYYAQSLQILIEDAELCLSEGLGVGTGYRVTIDERGLLRMDTVSQVASLKEAVGAGIMAPNEARADMDLPPVEGGESPLMQEQNYSLAALAKRDARADPFAKGAATVPPPAKASDDVPKDDAKTILALVLKNKLKEAA
jgi:HK97 family phage portal protein